MTDLVTEARQWAFELYDEGEYDCLYGRLADRIEALEAEVVRLTRERNELQVDVDRAGSNILRHLANFRLASERRDDLQARLTAMTSNAEALAEAGRAFYARGIEHDATCADVVCDCGAADVYGDLQYALAAHAKLMEGK